MYINAYIYMYVCVCVFIYVFVELMAHGNSLFSMSAYQVVSAMMNSHHIVSRSTLFKLKQCNNSA